MLEGLSGVRLKREEMERPEQRIQEVTGWDDPVEEKTGFVATACQNYEVLGKSGGGGPHNGTRPGSDRSQTRPPTPVRRRRKSKPDSG